MGIKEVILVFDIGKTNKKYLLFDRDLRVVEEKEIQFKETVDDDGFSCEDAEQLESWIDTTLEGLLKRTDYEIKGINFSTYGATLVYLNHHGERITPIYNYLKPLPEEVTKGFYETYGGKDEFCRATASPSLGMLNSGLQILWLKKLKTDVYDRAVTILHLPQYLSFRFTGNIASEHTSIGCHTAMWDFDRMEYHSWLSNEEISLPRPGELSDTFQVAFGNQRIHIGKGIHDSSASLAPYILSGREPFVLVSTGTWSISMNPFNWEPLTNAELESDCLCYLGVNKKPVKSSRFFLGRIHDANTEFLENEFGVPKGSFKKVVAADAVLKDAWNAPPEVAGFFRDGVPGDLVDRSVQLEKFRSFTDAYVHLMVALTRLVSQSIQYILSSPDTTRHLYITGGFTRNCLFTKMVAAAFPHKKVFTSETENASSLGAALVIASQVWTHFDTSLDLGLKPVETI